MTDHDKVEKIYLVVFGVEGQGGLVRNVEKLQEQVDGQEKRLNTISLKLALLLFLAGLIGNAIGQKVLAAINFAP